MKERESEADGPEQEQWMRCRRPRWFCCSCSRSHARSGCPAGSPPSSQTLWCLSAIRHTNTHTQRRGISLAEEVRSANADYKVHRFTYFTTDPKDQSPMQSHTAPWVSLLVWLWSINAGCKVYTNTGLLSSPLIQRTSPISAVTHNTLGITICLAVKHQCWLQSTQVHLLHQWSKGPATPSITHSTLGITISWAVKHQCRLQSIH